jgi:molybdopterin-containing oxidoreductase family membrane subunit
VACGAVIASIWIEKGLGMIIAGFVPSPFEQVVEYTPTGRELTIALGVYMGVNGKGGEAIAPAIKR